jgi:hypothetical protein
MIHHQFLIKIVFVESLFLLEAVEQSNRNRILVDTTKINTHNSFD